MSWKMKTWVNIKNVVVDIKNMWYIKDIKKNNRPQGGLPKWKSRKTHPYQLGQSFGVSFPMYGYLQNVKTNVSNAKRNMPNVSISLKSNWKAIPSLIKVVRQSFGMVFLCIVTNNLMWRRIFIYIFNCLYN